ncbi:dsRBD fold-containing protein [Streptomyces griseoluteus]|uniref:dsRBD fold-containing protein n=1 Tax=Streptomyces griseoluteus TaxID=29306 RepID=UPI0036AA7D39
MTGMLAASAPRAPGNTCEDDDGTRKAHVRLDNCTTALTGHGPAHCNPVDTNVPEIGDEQQEGPCRTSPTNC